MKDHQRWGDLLPFYCSGEIAREDRIRLEAHLADCPLCRADVEFWQSVAAETRAQAERLVPGPASLDRALARISLPTGRSHRPRLRFAFGLLRGQAVVLRTEIWISTAILMGLCFAASLVTESPAMIRLFAPFIAAASLAVIGGPQNDPAFELSRSTPVSPGKIILTRATLVFGYNVVLAIAAAAFFGTLIPGETLPDLIRDGLGPMSFLSALALFLSLWIGTANAVTVAALIWIFRIIPGGLFQRIGEALGAPGLGASAADLRSFWLQPVILIASAALLTLAAVWKADRQGLDNSHEWGNPS